MLGAAIGAISGLVGIKAGHVDFKLAMLISVGFALGGWLGGMWAQHLTESILRRGFALLLVVLAVKLAFSH